MPPLFIALLVAFIAELLCTVSGKVVYEEGYTVTTVLDGNKLKINPHAAMAGSKNLLVLDSSSSVFYTVSVPVSLDSEAKRLAGNGVSGFSDGGLDTSMFDKPRSFAVDSKGNVYVADKNNLAIRKISTSGVTTIAGGYSKKPGHADGPGQNASFSNDFEISYIADSCVLLVSDHGNKLIRQINLKPEDCKRSSLPAAGVNMILLLGLGLSCLLGVIIGFVVRPFVIRFEDMNQPSFIKIWKFFLMNPRRLAPKMLSLGTRSAAASSTLLTVFRRIVLICSYYVSLLYRMNRVRSGLAHKNLPHISDSNLLDSLNYANSETYADVMRDLITLDGGMDRSSNLVEHVPEVAAKSSCLVKGHGGIDDLIQSNFNSFVEGSKVLTVVECRSPSGSSVLLKRK
ncbi:hypothetical protein Drorol1_Dr00008165 [Drosera rotundifolia]